jgi:hypothetical protein
MWDRWKVRLRGGGVVVVEKSFLVVYGGGLEKPLEVGFHFKMRAGEKEKEREIWEGKKSGSVCF